MANTRLRIKSDGTPHGTHVIPLYDKFNHIVEGAELRGVQNVLWQIGIDGRAEAWIRVTNVDIVAEVSMDRVDMSPYDDATEKLDDLKKNLG